MLWVRENVMLEHVDRRRYTGVLHSNNYQKRVDTGNFPLKGSRIKPATDSLSAAENQVSTERPTYPASSMFITWM